MKVNLEIHRGTNDKPVASQALVDCMSAIEDIEGTLFIGYPIIGTADGKLPIDALFISPEVGIVVFDLHEGTSLGDFEERQDFAANIVESRLRQYKELVRRRKLGVDIHTLTFAPGLSTLPENVELPVCNEENLECVLGEFEWKDSEGDLYLSTISAIQSISTIRKSRIKRVVQKADSRGSKLKKLEESISTLDNLQGKAVIETVHGVQRIRGLAGSGKTIVLALKAAYLHAQHPNWRIGVTFNTRSLKGQFIRLITTFTLEQTGEEPDWENLRVLNAWGAPGAASRDGIYYEYCREKGIPYLDYRTAMGLFGRGKEFEGACKEAMKRGGAKKTELYDVLLVDEAQDFSPAFLQLCFNMLTAEKRLVYAYDELQNLAGQSLPSPEDIFGKDSSGKPIVSFQTSNTKGGRHDIILEKCYRNSRVVLTTAHALGFGIYRTPPQGKRVGLVQMFENSELWEEIGYESVRGEIQDGQEAVLRRTELSSPKFLEDHSSIDDLVHFQKFDDDAAQIKWLVDSIEKNLKEDELRHDDIVVINPDPRSTRGKVGLARKMLLERGISSHLAGVDTDPDVFYQPDSPSVTFSGIFRAKGNEAGMVYIINAQDCDASSGNLASIRNQLFTAITRSKAWVRVLGHGLGMINLMDEYRRLKDYNFELHFRYPTKEERQHLNIVHRDMTSEEKKRIKERKQSLTSLIEDLESGRVHKEDLDDELIEKLGRIFGKGS